MQTAIPEVFRFSQESADMRKLYGLDQENTKPFGNYIALHRTDQRNIQLVRAGPVCPCRADSQRQHLLDEREHASVDRGGHHHVYRLSGTTIHICTGMIVLPFRTQCLRRRPYGCRNLNEVGPTPRLMGCFSGIPCHPHPSGVRSYRRHRSDNRLSPRAARRTGLAKHQKSGKMRP
jgi:hypothetical protein